MEHDNKIKYLRIALSLQNIGVTDEISDRIITTFEKVLELGGDFSVNDAVKIECSLNEKYEKNKPDNG